MVLENFPSRWTFFKRKPIQKNIRTEQKPSVEETHIYRQGIQDIGGCRKTVSMKSYFHELAIIKGEAMTNDSLLRY